MSGHTEGPWVVDPKYPLAVRPMTDSTDDRRPGKLMVGNAEIVNLAGSDHIPNYGPGARATAYAKAYYGDSALIHPDITYEQAKANASLIAAAPDLLEAARSASQFYEILADSFREDEMTEPADDCAAEAARLRAAVAKAEGHEA